MSEEKKQSDLEQAPENSLPNWSDCSLRVGNAEYLKENNLQDDDFYDGSNLPNEIHNFIYEYDDSDPYRSAWFMHRLERLIDFVKADAVDELTKQLEQSQASHKDLVARNKILRDRLDLPVDRIEAHDLIIQLQASNARLKEELTDVCESLEFNDDAEYEVAAVNARKVLAETPQQSLKHIKAQGGYGSVKN